MSKSLPPSTSIKSISTTSSTTALSSVNSDNMLNRREGKLKDLDELELLEGGVNEKLLKESAQRSEQGGELSQRDKKALALLVVLYLLQGVPVGLAFGSIPFLLRSKLSYSQIGLFTLCTYPYSLKLLWSPIVDSFFIKKVGRRKSWIVPVQAVVGFGMWWLGGHIEGLLEVKEPDVNALTMYFFVLVFFAATQDIAVDGWALTLLSKENLSYASTAQTIGLNIGYFLSFTVFLAFNSVEFSNAYFRSVPLDHPLVSLGGYLKFWGIAFFVVTGYLAFFQIEEEEIGEEDVGVKKVYQIMWDICKLPHVQTFLMVHLLTKFGTSASDAATSLKLLEKGLRKEDLALAVLIDFPFQILFGYLAARWSKGDKPLKPWLIAMYTRLAWAVISMFLIHFFPTAGITNSYFFLVVAVTVGASFSSTVQFVGITAFHTQIADPLIGGTYMTLLNTMSNLGGTWPRFFVLKGVDAFTTATCMVKGENLSTPALLEARECVSEHGKALCVDLAGVCTVTRDGYYWISTFCIVAGLAVLIGFVGPAGRKLEALPLSAWRVKQDRR